MTRTTPSRTASPAASGSTCSMAMRAGVTSAARESRRARSSCTTPDMRPCWQAHRKKYPEMPPSVSATAATAATAAACSAGHGTAGEQAGQAGDHLFPYLLSRAEAETVAHADEPAVLQIVLHPDASLPVGAHFSVHAQRSQASGEAVLAVIGECHPCPRLPVGCRGCDLQRPRLRAKDPGSRAGMHAQPRVERQAVG